MRTMRWLAVGAVFLALAGPLEAQKDTTKVAAKPKPRVASLDAIIERPAKSKEDFKAIVMTGDEGDQKVLNTTRELLIDALNKTHSYRMENDQDFVQLLERAEVAPCGSGKTSFSRVRKKDGTFDLKGWVREIHRDEMCLWDGNRAILSLYCGNPTPNLYRQVAPAEKPESPVVRRETARVDTTWHRFTSVPRSTPVFPQEKSWWQNNRDWIIPVAALATAGGLVYMCVTDWCEGGDEITVINNNYDAVVMPAQRPRPLVSIPIGW